MKMKICLLLVFAALVLLPAAARAYTTQPGKHYKQEKKEESERSSRHGSPPSHRVAPFAGLLAARRKLALSLCLYSHIDCCRLSLGSFSFPLSRQGSDVRDLHVSDFEMDTQASTGATTGDWFVMFYGNCPHCKAMAPVWTRLATTLKGERIVARVDCSAEHSLCARFNVTSIPTMVMFRHGNMYAYPSVAERSHDALEAFAVGGFSSVSALQVPKERGALELLVADARAELTAVLHNYKGAAILLVTLGLLVGIILTALIFMCCLSSAPAAAPARKATASTHKKQTKKQSTASSQKTAAKTTGAATAAATKKQL
jgi:thiol-disulfide isomerase/thioredoxin